MQRWCTKAEQLGLRDVVSKYQNALKIASSTPSRTSAIKTLLKNRNNEFETSGINNSAGKSEFWDIRELA